MKDKHTTSGSKLSELMSAFEVKAEVDQSPSEVSF
jgi:hypothetical protein